VMIIGLDPCCSWPLELGILTSQISPFFIVGLVRIFKVFKCFVT
jgi:hypothetical protein